KCWYLGAQGHRVRPETSQAAPAEPVRAAPPNPQPPAVRAAAPNPQPPAAAPTAPQPTVYEITRRLNAEAPLDTTVGQGSPQAPAIVGDAADADTVAAPDGAPVLARDENADTVASAEEAKEDAPVVWPTPSIPEPPPASGLHPAYLLALLFGFIALVCFF